MKLLLSIIDWILLKKQIDYNNLSLKLHGFNIEIYFSHTPP